MINSCAQRELIASEVKQCQEACEGQHKHVGWPAGKQKTETTELKHSHAYTHERMHRHSYYSVHEINVNLTAFVSPLVMYDKMIYFRLVQIFSSSYNLICTPMLLENIPSYKRFLRVAISLNLCCVINLVFSFMEMLLLFLHLS